jgi:hypothetical protein
MKEWFEEKSVALVGNAQSLFDLSYGKEIDSHDVVVRLNKAAMLYTGPGKNFDCESSHGKRTDVWAFWNTNEYKQFLVSFNGKKMHMGHQGRHNATLLKMTDFVYPMDLYDNLKKHAGQHRNPSTGMLTLDYLIRCHTKTISVYGFDWKQTPTFTDPTRKKEKLCPHNFDSEKTWFYDVVIKQHSNVVLRQ